MTEEEQQEHPNDNHILQNEGNNIDNENDNNGLQEVPTERPTETTNNDARYTQVDNDFLFNPIEGFDPNNNINNNVNQNQDENNPEAGKNEEKTENLNQAQNNAQSVPFNKNKQTYTLKIIVLGNIAVGKTSVIRRYITNTFSDEHKTTIGCEYKKKTIEIDGETNANLQIWDTAGEEKFMSVTKQYYNDSNGAMIIYDLTKRDTFQKVSQWIKDVKEIAPKDVVIMVVGNKSDLTNEKVELGDELQPIKDNYLYQDVSAKAGTNVSLAFENLALKIIEKLKERKEKGDKVEQRESLLLKKTNNSNQKHKKCNC